MQAKRPHVAIIVLNWNGWQDTVECLESLFQIDYPNFLVIVVDNGSQDESVRMLREYAKGITRANASFCEHRSPDTSKVLIECKKDSVSLDDIADKSWLDAPSSKKMLIIKNERNEGFAEGNNVGIRAALTGESDYVLLLNNDTIVDKRFLSQLVQVAEDDQKAGFVGPKVYFYSYNGRTDVINFAGGKLDVLRGLTRHIGCWKIDAGQYDETTTVDYVEGSCMLVRKDMIKEVGMLNPLYVSYWEDVDWCVRARKRGYLSLLASKAKIWHKVSSSDVGENKQYYFTRNTFWFLRENASRGQYICYLFYFLAFDMWYHLGSFFYYKKPRLLRPFMRGVADGLKRPRLTDPAYRID